LQQFLCRLQLLFQFGVLLRLYFSASTGKICEKAQSIDFPSPHLQVLPAIEISSHLNSFLKFSWSLRISRSLEHFSSSGVEQLGASNREENKRKGKKSSITGRKFCCQVEQKELG
jgi:hypothetical protein